MAGAEGGRGVGDEVGRWGGGEDLESRNHREDLAFLGATGEPLEGFGQSSDKMCLRLSWLSESVRLLATEKLADATAEDCFLAENFASPAC